MASAQEATIVGTVTDASGSVVPNVSITITNTDTGLSRKLNTNEAGQYVVPGLIVGHYSVRAENPGFKMAERSGIALNVGDRIRIDLPLQVGETKESVNVEASPIAVQTDSGEVSHVINGEQVSQLATDGRNIYSLANLVPGASSAMPNFNTPTSAGGNANVSFNGQRQNHNIWLADGAEQSDRGGAGGAIINPSIEAIGEFRVLTSNYSSDYGLSSAGTISMVFKSGTKDFHASAWEFLRNNDFDANDFFRNKAGLPTRELRLNVFGFNAGGPVTFGKLYNKERNKTFFFYNMEWRKLINQGGVNTTVPQDAWYTGNLSTLSTQLHVPSASQLSPTQLSQWAALGYQPGDAIRNNQIPTQLIDPNAKALLSAGIFPKANQGASTFVGGNNLPTNVREELVRIDHQFSDKFWVFGHWVAESTAQNYGPPMWSGVNVPTVGNTFSNPSYTGVIHATNAISPTLINEVGFNYDGNRIAITPTGLYQTSSVSGFSMKTLFGADAAGRIPGIALAGSTGTNFSSTSFPWNNKADDYQVRDDVTWTKGAHQMRMGGGWAIYKKVQDLFGTTQGSFNFNGKYTGNDFADFLLGYANNYNELALQDNGHWNAASWNAYFQDNWRVSRRLTLNLGIRWDGIPHTYEADHRMSNFYTSEYDSTKRAILLANGNIDPSSPGLGKSPNPALSAFTFYLNGIGITGMNGNPNGMVNDSWNNWGPRLGLAYDLTGTGKTVLRGGFASMFERIQGNDMYNSGSNVPFSASVTNNDVSLRDPNTNLATGLHPTAPITVSDVVALNISNYKAPVTYQFSLGVEQQLGSGTVVSAGYVGNQSRHQFAYREFNLPPQSQLANLINNGTLYNSLVPYTGFHSIRMGENAENSHYNGMQLSLRSRLKDLQVQASYTLSKAIDPAGGNSFGGDNTNTDNPYDYRYDYGPAWWDARQIGVMSFVYDLPIFRRTGNRFEKTVVGGWQVSGVWTIQSGFPLYITEGGAQGSNGLANATNFPNFNGTITYPHNADRWFTTEGFSNPALGAWGNLKKGEIVGPGRNNWNISMFKSFLISEARNSRFELRFESFNTFNHTQFNAVGTTFSNLGQFGTPTGTYDPRTLQFGARLLF
ncbi:MAG TPA: carboxypeptidase regulatory-like domain-containing protein [Bryobacteraceae bacterium]|nr:carboxypeptidase regulatory-like domain-containing protein [Bryobacteraceae bacterium]